MSLLKYPVHIVMNETILGKISKKFTIVDWPPHDNIIPHEININGELLVRVLGINRFHL